MRLLLPLTAAAVLGLGISSVYSQAEAKSVDAKAEAPPEPTDPVEQLVKKFGYPSKGLTGVDLARSLLLEAGANGRVAALIQDLSGSDFAKRERAVADLIGISAPIDGALWEARKNADPGLAIMLDRTLETRQNLRSLERTGYLFKLIAETPLQGLAVPIAGTISKVEIGRDLEIVRVGLSAIIKTVTPADGAALDSILEADPEGIHIGALTGKAVLALRAGEELPGTNDRWSKLGLAYALTALGDSRAVDSLVGLLGDESPLIRSEASRLLLACTLVAEHYVGPHDSTPARLAKINSWKTWIEKAGGKPEIEAVFPDAGWRGVVLVGAGGKEGTRVMEFGMAGQQVRQFPTGKGGVTGVPRSAFQTGDGRIFVLSTSGADASALHLFDESGLWVWSAEGVPGANGLAISGNGNYLVCDAEKPLLNEYDWLAKKVGARAIPGVATSLQMLPAGRILATLPAEKAIVEIDLDGAEIWRLGNLEGVRYARRLANGHHLIIRSDGLVEFDGKGKEVWNVPASKNGQWGEIHCAARRPGGNTFLGTDQGLKEITPGQRVLRQVIGGQIHTVESY